MQATIIYFGLWKSKLISRMLLIKYLNCTIHLWTLCSSNNETFIQCLIRFNLKLQWCFSMYSSRLSVHRIMIARQVNQCFSLKYMNFSLENWSIRFWLISVKFYIIALQATSFSLIRCQILSILLFSSFLSTLLCQFPLAVPWFTFFYLLLAVASQIGLPNLTNKNTGHANKYEF